MIDVYLLLACTGHFESGATATLQAVASSVPGADLERAKLLWHSGHENRALAELQAARRRCVRARTQGWWCSILPRAPPGHTWCTCSALTDPLNEDLGKSFVIDLIN